MNTPALVLFLDYGIDYRVRMVKSLFPAGWEWGKVIVITNDRDDLSFAIPEGATKIKLSDFRPDSDTYHVVIGNGAFGDDLARVLMRIARLGCPLRAYRYYVDCGNTSKLQELE